MSGGVSSADITFDNIYAQFGNLDGLVTPYFGTLSGEGIYIRKGYIEGAIHVTGGNAATQEFVSTEIGKGIADLSVGVDNLLLNTAFAGDYLPAELEEMTLFNRQKILYSDPLLGMNDDLAYDRNDPKSPQWLDRLLGQVDEGEA